MIIFLKNKHTLQIDDFYFKCCIGKNGLSRKKIEGDNKTPKGTFELGFLYYRDDRIKNLKSNIKKIKINKKMGWCDDKNDKKNYNKLIKISKNIKHEKLYRKDKKYDLIIPIKYNFKNRILGKGSCIFLHLTKNYRATAGCIAIKENDFMIMLKLITNKTKIKIC
ncbi:MAG: transpeptidase [Candidatus Pelagibacter sp. TMED196]|nr:MAG: transpeptidase [Candidatus Pelagibacter sp. TMED196]